MREIKFRARRADTGAWVYGDLTHAVKINTKEQADESGKRSQPVLRVANYDVDENTIGQYTGVDDTLGYGIFEGDILLQTIPERSWIVEYKDGAFYACRGGDIYIALIDFAHIYVYGNIHDNPELIKQQEK